jgi:hypothetical protein
MQQVRKPKPADRSRMTAGKLARNRRSAEQMLMELRQRLREINDLNAAGDVLNWDQATLSLPKTLFKLTRGLRRNQNIIAA